MTALTAIPENMEIGGFALRERPAVPKPPAPIPTAYDLERHIGLAPFDNNPAVAKRNRVLLNAALEAMRPDGSFKFTDGSIGPVLYPIQAAGKAFYFQGHIQTNRRQGGAIYGVGGHAPPLGDGDFGVQTGALTRFVRIDPDPKGCVLRVRCGGFTSHGIQYYGRYKPGDLLTGSGPKTGVGIQYEGRDRNPTIGLDVSGFAVVDCDTGIQFLSGYYDDAGNFVSERTHADEAHFSQGRIYNCRVGIKSDNDQSVWCVFDGVKVQQGNDPCEAIIESSQGGLWTFRNFGIGTWDASLIRLGEKGKSLYSPNACRFDIQMYRDGFPGDGRNRLTLVEYVGKGEPWMDPDIRIWGSIAEEIDVPKMYDLFRFNGISSKNIWVDVTNIEHVPGIDWEVVGPWRRLKQ